MKVDWKCVLIKDGALSMEMDGHILILKWPADNLDTLLQVSKRDIYSSAKNHKNNVLCRQVRDKDIIQYCLFLHETSYSCCIRTCTATYMLHL